MGQQITCEDAEKAITLIERASYKIPQFADQIRKSGLPSEAQKSRALQVLEHLVECMDEIAPDHAWWRDYHQLSGEHWVLTEEGWMPARFNTMENAGEEPLEVLDEVNAPANVV